VLAHRLASAPELAPGACGEGYSFTSPATSTPEPPHKAQPRPRRNGPCIYCRSTTNAFTTCEHPFAESAVGRNDKILPRGAVCDPCNHEVNNHLDEALAEFSPTAMIRVDLGIAGKDGKPAKAKFQNATLERRPAPAIERDPKGDVALILHHDR
jgi:hypothetical protein